MTALGLGLGACAAAPPQQANNAAQLPDAGPDGEYRAEFPEPKQPEARYLLMTVSEDVQARCNLEPHFAFDDPEPRPQDAIAVDVLAECLKHPAIEPYDVLLVGRADPRGSDAYNLELAKKRAERIERALIEQGVDADRLTIVSRGEEDAKGTADGEFSYGYDRRVDVVLLGQDRAPVESGVGPLMMAVQLP